MASGLSLHGKCIFVLFIFIFFHFLRNFQQTSNFVEGILLFLQLCHRRQQNQISLNRCSNLLLFYL